MQLTGVETIIQVPHSPSPITCLKKNINTLNLEIIWGILTLDHGLALNIQDYNFSFKLSFLHLINLSFGHTKIQILKLLN